jgi:tetratricopeptide (TPR) repeat protein
MKNRLLQSFLLTFVFLHFFQAAAFAKDEWLVVQSKNFKLIGNASEKDIRKVATRLEQFREVFRRAFAGLNLTSSTPTNVIVFKSNSAYTPFKPKRADGKIDNFVAGFFQPGEDVNYITLSTEGEDAETFKVIFHEYVHFLVNTNVGKSNVPPWFNEGLAEYYSTFAIENDQKVSLGLLQQNHLNFLATTKLIPLETLFAVGNFDLLQQGNHSRSIFYAESWALIHYLVQTGKTEGLGKFLLLSMKDTPPARAFEDSFQMTYAQMEKELAKYVSQNTYKYSTLTFQNKLIFENEMQTAALSEAATNAYLGDSLYHNNRAADAEAFLQKAISLDDKQSAAYTTLGMIRFRQGKYVEARNYLEKAVSDDQKNPLALYYYAYALGQQDDKVVFGAKFPAETSAKMRDALKKSIALNPSFAGSYELLAFISLVNSENLDEAIQMLHKAQRIEPGNQRFNMRIAEIYLRQEKYEEARAIAEKIAKTADDPELKSRAENLRASIESMQESRAQYEASRKAYEAAATANDGQRPALARGGNGAEKRLTPEEIAKLQEEEKMISLNQAVRKPVSGERQAIGHITKINCVAGKITYTVKTDKETLSLFSKDFESLALVALTEIGSSAQVGCAANIANISSVVTFKETAKTPPSAVRELVAIDFVPDNFKFVDTSKSQAIAGSFNDKGSPGGNSQDTAAGSQDSMTQAIKRAMRQPQTGEKREQGFIENIDCSSQGMLISFRTETRIIKIAVNPQQPVQIRAFTKEVGREQVACGMKSLDTPVVFTYRPNADPKVGSSGELVILEFMPNDFKLEELEDYDERRFKKIGFSSL